MVLTLGVNDITRKLCEDYGRETTERSSTHTDGELVVPEALYIGRVAVT